MTGFSFRLVRHAVTGGSPSPENRSVTLARVPDDMTSFTFFIPWAVRYTSTTLEDLRDLLREMETALDKPILDYPEDFNVKGAK